MTNKDQAGDGDRETLSQRVARRLRGRMAELQLRGTDVAAAVGMTQGSFSRRFTGSAPWELDELEILEEKVGISIAYLLGWDDPAGERPATGAIPYTPPPPPPVTLIGPVPDQVPAPPPPSAPEPPRQLFADPAPIRYDRGSWPGAVQPFPLAVAE